MFDVVVVGSINLDLVVRTARLPGPGETVGGHDYAEHPGGKGLNQAVAAARAGARTALVGAVGDDAAGHRLLDVAAGSGVDTSLVHVRRDSPTGRALITVSDDAENSIVVVPGANATATASELPPAHVVVAQLEVPHRTVLAAFRSAREIGVRTVLDPAPAGPLADELVEATDVIVPNEHEIELIGGREALMERGVQAVVVTRGAAGVVVRERTGAGDADWSQPAFEVDARDTTGAGDAFCGVLAAGLAAGGALAGAVRRAAAAGALAATVPGAVPSLPSRQRIDELLSAGRDATAPPPPTRTPR